MVQSPDRTEKLAAALRENLKKRKSRQRALADQGAMQPVQETDPGEDAARPDAAKEEVSPAEKPR